MENQKNRVESEGAALLSWAAQILSKRKPASNEEALGVIVGSDLEGNLVRLLKSREFRQRFPQVFHELSPGGAPISVEVAAGSEDIASLLGHVLAASERVDRTAPVRSGRLLENQHAIIAAGATSLRNLERTFARNGLRPVLDRALQLGCSNSGATLALAGKYDRIFAYDVSFENIRTDESLVRDEKKTNVTFRPIVSPVSFEDSVDLIFSESMLHQCPPPVIYEFLDKSFKCLRRGGIAYFVVPTYILEYRFAVKEYLRKPEDKTGKFELHCIPQRSVYQLAENHGLSVIEVKNRFDSSSSSLSNYFVLQRR